MTYQPPPDPPETDDDLDRRAGELARRVMSMPYRKQEWPKRSKAAEKSKE